MSPSLVALKSPGPGAISVRGARRVHGAAAGAKRGRVGNSTRSTAAAAPRAPPPPDAEVAAPGETAAAAGDEPEPDPRMMGLRAPPSDARAARAKKLRERATVIAAKGRYNKQGAIPAAILGMLYDFVDERARDVGLLPRTALPAHSRDGNLRALARKARDKI